MTNELKTILWDFDGVILDSMPIREQGFKLVFKSFPRESVNELINYHRANGGLSRYVKIRFFFERILKKEITDKEVQSYADLFSSRMLSQLNNPALIISDTLNFIKSNFQKYDMHIVSGSDQKELRLLCQMLEINDYFKSILGSPTSKKILVQEVINKYNYNRSNTVLIGDSQNDYQAAVDNDIMFYGFNNVSLRDTGDDYIHSFDDGGLF